MLDSTVVCRRALGCEWGDHHHGERQTERERESPHRHTHTTDGQHNDLNINKQCRRASILLKARSRDPRAIGPLARRPRAL